MVDDFEQALAGEILEWLKGWDYHKVIDESFTRGYYQGLKHSQHIYKIVKDKQNTKH